jgi:radical SAM protein with 4Fe4S-binding SPASM domain
VLGEPLLHPQLEAILARAQQAQIQVNITTNGGLLGRNEMALLRYPVRQLNVSLHDAEENIPSENWDSYLNKILVFATQAAPNTYINLRLWNGGVESSVAFSSFCKTQIAQYFNIDLSVLIKNNKDSGLKLADHVFLQTAPRFEWPDGDTLRTQNTKTCYALRDQLAVLVDGTIVPCCLDADGAMNLGNIFTQALADVLNSERALKIRHGFQNNKITETHCKSCGFFISQ